MLIRFRARNFRSLKDEQELSLVASISLKDSLGAVTEVEGFNLGLLRVAAIYGANASGKTNVIKAVEYMDSAVCGSQRHWRPEGPIPRQPFLLDPQSKSDVSSFEVDLLLNRTRFRYGFELDDLEIRGEWLDAYPEGKKQMWFKREGKVFTFGKKLTGENRAIESLTRPNSLFLSAAAQNNHEALLPIYKWFAEQLAHVRRERGPLGETTAEMCEDGALKSSVLALLCEADLGVTGLDLREEKMFPPITDAEDAEERALREELVGVLRKIVAKAKAESEAGTEAFETTHVLSLIHRGAAGGKIPLGEDNESDGTLAFFGLLGPALRAIKTGGTVCVDELDSSLHPLLAVEVVRMFNDPERNPRGAQLIFTTHDTNILQMASLRRDQIWFTEKDGEGSTHLYPLTDFKPRKNENLQRGYLQGRYGAVPFIGSPHFLPQGQRSEG